jgi:hypothetical protein
MNDDLEPGNDNADHAAPEPKVRLRRPKRKATGAPQPVGGDKAKPEATVPAGPEPTVPAEPAAAVPSHPGAGRT